ncbi:LOW QUALITY PROTEIN: pentatricopeptide repeat-containing protein At4g16470-like [Neltuma alba]|uniref:LOW QUALITY PROTEIN: pentatricopeptide repeat-containing protein At4g16470-like n=1 Tax=Neltuma alba TaxID=207710 RepID=UPI0010A2C437|nr:LOW QUALITY PROTEIN: pentatricopeptide repeat-containing protein At4g16470-like [Prosopis alba]
MKSMRKLKFAVLFSHLPKIEITPSISWASDSVFCSHPVRILNPLHLISTSLSLSNFNCLSQNRRMQMEAFSSPAGEIHAIVGPMLSVKRIQLENNNISFQVKPRKGGPNLDKVLKGLCISGRLAEAIGLLCRTGLAVHSRTYSLLLQESILRKEYKKARRIHAQMIVVGYVPNEYLKTKLLILYAKSGYLETARTLFNNLAEKGLVSWNAIIAGYIQKGLEEVGLDFFYLMRQSGLRPDQYTFASVYRACATLASLEPGKQAHGVMIKCQIKDNVVVNSALIDMYFKCSSIHDGQLLFDKCLSRNTITWTALISGYGQHGSVVEVIKSFHKMISEGFRPNYVTFLAVLSACSHGGLIDEGWKYFLSMTREYEIPPRSQHYATMVDLLGRAGKLKEAYEFVLNSPFKEHAAVWGALIGACKIHGDRGLLKVASKKFFELEPANAGKHVVLANAYANSGLWDNVEEVWTLMRKSGMVKEPGYSRIEVQREVFLFYKGDTSHHKSDEIYKLSKEMRCIPVDAEYMPDICGT